MREKKDLGDKGEQAAAELYQKNGFFVVAKNWRYKKVGEIDIILLSGDKSFLVFSEVKTRKSNSFAAAASAVNYKKQLRMRRLAEIFMAQNPDYSGKNVRFDVVEVYPLEINVIEGAF